MYLRFEEEVTVFKENGSFSSIDSRKRRQDFGKIGIVVETGNGKRRQDWNCSGDRKKLILRGYASQLKNPHFCSISLKLGHNNYIMHK